MVKLMPMQEFWDSGYLQEVNRQFFHPLGLALAISMDPEGNVTNKVYIWDARDDPEGIAFEADTMRRSKGIRVVEEQNHKHRLRHEALGYVIQPLPEEDE